MEEQADVLINFVVVGGFAILVAALVSAFLNDGKPFKKECKIHKWSHHPVTNKLTCEECSYEAGSHKTDKGQY